jgi:hypothetical protein
MQRPYKGKWLLLPVVLSALLVSPSVFAQETTAGVQGTVRDPSGASVANATVEISGASLLGTRKVQTDDSGAYRVTALPAGAYTLTVTVPGFRTFKQVGIDLAVGRLPNVDVKLEVGAVAETVEVASDASAVDVTQSKVQATVSRELLEALPEGRSFQSVIPFAAGARSEPLQGGANGFQIDGASNGENVYLIDGVNTTNILNGGVGKSFQMDFVDEVQVKSSSFEAEFGGALGGVINATGKRGSNNWHGTLVTYYQSNALNNNNGDRALRINPATSRNTTTRIDGTPEYYSAKPDQASTVEPGYTVGGALVKNKLWIFSSYIPSISTTRRTTNFTGLNPGPRTLTQTATAHNAYNRLDYGVTSNLRLFGSWNYGYSRNTGTLGGQDSNYGQRNTGSSTDPNTFRSDAGSVNPLAVYSFGGDWTPTAKLVVSARYGYFFNNNEQRGAPQGLRFVYQTSVSASTTDLTGAAMPSSLFNTAGFANIPNNLSTAFDAYKRKGLNVDASYFVGHLGGTHTFKGGFFYQTQSNNVLATFNGGRVDLFLGNSAYSPVTNPTACDAIKASNVANFGASASACQGRYGYFVVGTGVVNTGGSSQTAKALYFQDAWQVGHGLTLNLGLRLDNEIQPPYNTTLFPSVKFGWGDKIAPRLGAAYDLLHNGKVKIYASYGKFYDIMKMGLARGSFGSDYWHNCVYALDTPVYTTITPTYPIGGGCPASGPAPGVTVGRFIENVDFRATKADPRDPAIAPDMKPMLQHEYVMGVDWAVTPNWSVETRYSRKRLDRTIEDMAITDNLGFYIGNPGSTIADVLHRPTVIPDDNGNNYLNNVPFCAECPKTIPAIRRYDGAEISLAKRSSGKWFGKLTYSYSRLTGNYAGLTNTDPTDGGTAGRLSPNNSRAFDIPTMTYLPSGKIDDGPLSTDRPNTAKAYGFYRLKWLGGTTLFGITQAAYQGTPLDTCLPVVGTSSACQWAEGRGNFVHFTRAANGDITKVDVQNNARSDPYIQTDLSIHHEILVHEGMRMEVEGNFLNVFNQRAILGVSEFVIPTSLINPSRPARFPGDLQVDFGKVMNGYNYVDALNGAGAFAGVQSKLTLASLYGMPNSFQTGRAVRLAVRFVF